MKIDSTFLLKSFKENLKLELTKTPTSDFHDAWKSSSARTRFYTDDLLPRISHNLSFKFEKEKYFRIDGIMFQKATNNQLIPAVFIESENDSKSAEKEVYKLCALNAPLKVLFLCMIWNEGVKEEHFIDYWDNIMNAYMEVSQLIGNFLFVIAEGTDKLRYHILAFDDKGIRIEDMDNFIELEY